MAVSNHKCRALAPFALAAFALLAFTMTAPRAHGAAAPQQAIALDAQSSELDLRSNNVLFRKVHIAQGATTVSADMGSATKQATGLDFDNSLWIFRGNVKITMDD